MISSICSICSIVIAIIAIMYQTDIIEHYTKCRHETDGVTFGHFSFTKGNQTVTTWHHHCSKCGKTLMSTKGYVEGQPNYIITI